MHTYFITQQILSDKVITPQTQMCIYHALINALRAHMIHISLNIFYTHVEHSPTKTIYKNYCTKTKQKMHYEHTHTHTHTHIHTAQPDPGFIQTALNTYSLFPQTCRRYRLRHHAIMYVTNPKQTL